MTRRTREISLFEENQKYYTSLSLLKVARINKSELPEVAVKLGFHTWTTVSVKRSSTSSTFGPSTVLGKYSLVEF